MEYARKHGMDFKSAQEVENARKHSMEFKSVQKELKKNKLYKSNWKKGSKLNQKHQIIDSEKPQKNQNASQNDTWTQY